MANESEIKDTRDEILKEIQYRRDKQWKLFSWTTSLMLAAIGGVVTISSSDYFTLNCVHRATLSGSIFLLALYSSIWLTENINREEKAIDVLKKNERESVLPIGEIYDLPPKKLFGKEFYFGYVYTILGIAVVAILSFWLIPPKPKPGIAITFDQSSYKISVSVPGKTIDYNMSNMDSAIKMFRGQIAPK